MNFSTAIFIINDSVRAIEVTYAPEDQKAKVGLSADGKVRKGVFKTLDTSIKVGDFVVIPTSTRWQMTVCKVSAVNVDIDLESPALIEWAIGKVDLADYESNKKQEAQAVEIIRDADIADKRKKLREKLAANTLDNLKALSITDINGDQPHP